MSTLLLRCRRPEVAVYFALVFFGVIFVGLTFFTQSVDDRFSLFYLRALVLPFEKAIPHVVVLGALLLLFRSLLFIFRFVRNKEYTAQASLGSYFRGHFFSFFIKSRQEIGLIFLILITFFLSSLSLGSLNALNAQRLMDDSFMKLDLWFTGSYPFITLHALSFPDWFGFVIIQCFYYLVFLFTALAFAIFILNRPLFRELVSAYFAGLVLMFIIWALFPALSPHDRYIDNVYRLPVASHIQTELSTYDPGPSVREFLNKMREFKSTSLKVLPTSTFPSAHVGWGVFLIYYAFRFKKWLGVVVTPIMLLSSLGTFFLAQHYFVDAIAGTVVAIASIVLARKLIKREVVVLR